MSNTDFPDVSEVPVSGDPYHDDPAVRAAVNPTTASTDPRLPPELRGQQLTAFEPSWRQRLAQWWEGDKPVSPETRQNTQVLLGTSGLNAPSMSVSDLTPAAGVFGAQEAARGGDYQGAAIAGLGVLPGFGTAERVGAAGVGALERGITGAVARGAGSSAGVDIADTAARSAAHEGDRVSTRVPWAVGTDDNAVHTTPDFKVGLQASKDSGQAYVKNAATIGEDYTGHGIQLPENLTPDQITEAYVEHMKDNLLAIHDMMPDEIRERAKNWYDGANKMTHDLANDYELQPRQVAAVIASQSPQRPWQQNISLTHRILDINRDNQTSLISPEMRQHAEDYIAQKGPTSDAGVDAQAFLDENQGKQFKDMSTFDQAHFVRFHDSLYHDRGFAELSPEGDFLNQVMNKPNKQGEALPAQIQWGSMTDIQKAQEALRDGSVENISRNALGDQHKVRSFYNNIIAPYSPEGDVTIDTHAAAGGTLYPLGAADQMTAEALGSRGSSNASTGALGLYGLYHEAMTRAAAARNVLPRQMQSMTWEGAKSFFPQELKAGSAYRAGIEQPWNDYQNGVLTLPQAHQRVFDAANLGGSYRTPPWALPGAGTHAETGYPTYTGELSKRGVYGRPTQTAGRGGGGGAAAAVPGSMTEEPVSGDPWGG